LVIWYVEYILHAPEVAGFQALPEPIDALRRGAVVVLFRRREAAREWQQIGHGLAVADGGGLKQSGEVGPELD
jgi:hypothetical protein